MIPYIFHTQAKEGITMKRNARKLLALLLSIMLLFTACSQPTKMARPNPLSENTALGDPIWQIENLPLENHFLIERDIYTISYNNETHNPNWVSWHLDYDDFKTGGRHDSFRADDSLPAEWYKVDERAFKGSGFARGHMCPSGDRTTDENKNRDTFYMTNMVPQSPTNNSGAWETFERYIRLEHAEKGQEAYVICGPYGTGGESSKGKMNYITATGTNSKGKSQKININVPAYTWKVVIILDEGDDDINRITADTEAFAVWMPNTKQCSYEEFNPHIISIDYVEEMTGYDFFANLPDDIEEAIESRKHEDVIGFDTSKPWKDRYY